MWKAYSRFWLECSFVLLTILTLKIWVFPFFITLWYPTDDLSAQMMEWTVIMVGVVTLFLYLGLGSISKHVYHFGSHEASCLLAVLHLPLFFPLAGIFSDEWNHLLNDLMSLFSIDLLEFPGSQVWICWTLFLLGRKIALSNKKQKGLHTSKGKKEKIEQKLQTRRSARIRSIHDIEH